MGIRTGQIAGKVRYVMEEKLSFDLMGIQSCQRNRYPLLFVDKIIEAIPSKSARGIKNFTFNEWYFPAHFDDDPNVPGFVLVECLVQTFLMTFLCMEEYRGMETSFVSINNVKFKKKVVPGDRLEMDARLDSFRRGVAKGHVDAFVDGIFTCSADFVVAITEVLDQYKPKETE